MADALLRTPFFDGYGAFSARLVDFHGWQLPVQFASLIEEHQAVRTGVGVFDVSHMGEATAVGQGAAAFVNYLVTNDASKLEDGRAMYTPMCRPDGGIVDDLLVYRVNSEHWFLCFNGANVGKDTAWMAGVAEDFDCEFQGQSEFWGQLAIQGPKALAVMEAVGLPDLDQLQYYHFLHGIEIAGVPGCILARTGYTGEDGFEIFCPIAEAMRIWEAVFSAGADHGIRPCGLGARDTLRLEAKFLLYGNDMSDDTNPLEAGLGWTVKFDKGDFSGRDALLAVKENGLQRRLVGFEMVDRGIARHGYHVVDEQGERIGEVTSGTHSPTLGKAIGLAYVPYGLRKRGTELAIRVRKRSLKARVVKTPFYKRSNPTG